MTCSCQNHGTVRTAASTEPLDQPFPAPAYPPATWFSERPEWLTPGTKLTVDDDGRVAGYFYNSGQCLVHDASACVQASPTQYAAFHQQHIATDDGNLLTCGVIGNVNGHADPYGTIASAVAHYADPDRQIIACCAYDDEHGGYILGSILPEVGAAGARRAVNYGDIAMLRRSALSGDWRPFPQPWFQAHGQNAIRAAVQGEWYDCIGPTLVTRPGLPLIQRFGTRAAALGGAGGVQLDEQEQRMEGTTVVVNGVEITVPHGAASPIPPGPHPANQAAAATFLAAPPPNAGPPNAADNGEGGDGNGASDEEPETEARIKKLEQDVADIKNVLGQLIDAVAGGPGAVAAAALPE